MMRVIIEGIGWTSAVLLLLAYWLLSTGRLHSSSPAYHTMNIIGAAGFIVNSGWNGAFPSAALNVIWMVIGVWTLSRRRDVTQL